MRILTLRDRLEDRRGIASLEYALLAAVVVTAILAGSAGFGTMLANSMDRIAALAEGPATVVKFGPD